ncbi:ABC transporter permease [Haloglomus litoreum]|uniref:ABC transporter permease n=1 Tax=Haloglomus litoreum TaxID=3034026 RepID=UPI0023E79646|nr:FtsX-like permease family protein [Haloglomus sp. DT116]
MNPFRRLAVQFPTLVLARRNLSRATARTVLAVVAIVIGVVAIGAIGAGGEAFKQDQLQAYEGFGGTATVDPVFYPEEDGEPDRTFTDAEIGRMRRASGGATVLPVVEPSGAFVRSPSGDPLLTVQVRGLGDPGAFYDAQAGTIPANWRRSIIVGSRVAADNDIQPGDRMTVLVDGEFERSFRVAAVLEPQGFADPLSADQTVFVPLAQFDDAEYGRAIVRVDPQVRSVDDAAAGIEAEFNDRRRTVAVSTVQDQREQFEQFFATVNQFLIGIGAISLLVAAVTIANTMLMSAIEREGEIGVFRAVGYPKRAVVSLLVAEATILGIVGSAIGAPIALGIGALVNGLLVGDPLAFTDAGLRYIGLGVAFGIVTALVAGIYPAWKAANRPPVEVLG